MPFKFVSDDADVETGFRRIAIEQASKAAEAARATGEDRLGAIHVIRRRSKKIRALLRLVRGSFRDYDRENETVRDTARTLGQLRDRRVMLETYDALVADVGAAPDAGERQRLALRLSVETPADPGLVLAEVARTIDALVERAGQWKLRKADFAAIEHGLGKTYRAMREGMATAHKRPTAENLHDWRKLAKYHGHHLGLISGSAPHVLLASRAAANELADVLGRHHDLDMLAGCLDDDTPLAAVLKQRRADLEDEAFRLGRELSAEPPKAFVARCRAYWAEWRG